MYIFLFTLPLSILIHHIRVHFSNSTLLHPIKNNVNSMFSQFPYLPYSCAVYLPYLLCCTAWSLSQPAQPARMPGPRGLSSPLSVSFLFSPFFSLLSSFLSLTILLLCSCFCSCSCLIILELCSTKWVTLEMNEPNCIEIWQFRVISKRVCLRLNFRGSEVISDMSQ